MTSSAQLLAEAQKAAETARAFLTRVSSEILGHNLYELKSQFTGISYLQQSITGQSGHTNETIAKGDTSHHVAVDEAHPEKISEFLRDQNRSMTKEEGK